MPSYGANRDFIYSNYYNMPTNVNAYRTQINSNHMQQQPIPNHMPHHTTLNHMQHTTPNYMPQPIQHHKTPNAGCGCGI